MKKKNHKVREERLKTLIWNNKSTSETLSKKIKARQNILLHLFREWNKENIKKRYCFRIWRVC